MGHRLSKIYTRTGDSGDTGLADGSRLPKTAARIDAIGELDELNSLLGVLSAEPGIPHSIAVSLRDLQHALFDLGGELAIPGAGVIKTGDVTQLEKIIDVYNAELPPLKEFILPGGSRAAALCHLARSVCRRVERALLRLMQSDDATNRHSLAFVNRLSDLLFVWARILARESGCAEVLWEQNRWRHEGE